MMPVRRTISMLTLILLTVSCGTHGAKEAEEGKIRPVAYSEGDTLELETYPPNLATWMAFYHDRFPDFRNGTFHASGVVLHLDSLPASTSPEPPDSVRHGFAWSKDGRYYVDIREAGDIDQEVVLGRADVRDRRLIMFNGPGDVVETADWLGNDVFVLSRATSDEKQEWTPSIYLFSLKDSTFTDFRWVRSIPVERVMGLGDEFQQFRKQGDTDKP